jgi:hypothetical protein
MFRRASTASPFAHLSSRPCDRPKSAARPAKSRLLRGCCRWVSGPKYGDRNTKISDRSQPKSDTSDQPTAAALAWNGEPLKIRTHHSPGENEKFTVFSTWAGLVRPQPDQFNRVLRLPEHRREIGTGYGVQSERLSRVGDKVDELFRHALYGDLRYQRLGRLKSCSSA